MGFLCVGFGGYSVGCWWWLHERVLLLLLPSGPLLLLPFGEKVGMRGGSCAVLHWIWLLVLAGSPDCSPAAGFLLFAPSPLRGEGWDEGRVLRRLSLGIGFGWVARLLACGGLSLACRPASYFSLLAQREVAKRNGLWSPPTLQALALEVFWNRRDTSCSTFGHTAPSPFTEGGAWVSQLASLCSLQPGRTASSLALHSIPRDVIPAKAGIHWWKYSCVARKAWATHAYCRAGFYPAPKWGLGQI